MEEHAQLLLQYSRPGAKVHLKDVHIGQRTAEAIKCQWKSVLSSIVKAAPDVSWPSNAVQPPSAPDYGGMRARLDACCYDLRDYQLPESGLT